MDAAAPAAMEAEPTKVSVKTMKETIRSAGLPTADLLEKRDIEARYAEALTRLEERERPSGPPPVTPKKRRRIIEESDDSEDCEMGETLSAAERSRRAQEAAVRAGEVQDVDEPGPWLSSRRVPP